MGEHPRRFNRDQITYDPWHYVPVLERKPGALRNGAPFKDWELPPAMSGVQAKLGRCNDGDRQMVKILAGVLSDGLDEVEVACTEALASGTFSADVILNLLARRTCPRQTEAIETPAHLRLCEAPIVDCARYDGLRTPPPMAQRSVPELQCHGAP